MQIVRLQEVIKMTSLSRTSIYTNIQQGAFPKPIKIGKRAIGFIRDEIDKWFQTQMTNRTQIPQW